MDNKTPRQHISECLQTAREAKAAGQPGRRQLQVHSALFWRTAKRIQ
ncbi:hypothetical protein [Azotobacter beijerinckii]|nr:hypothetical protein [Azotobacter beijerinckii]